MNSRAAAKHPTSQDRAAGERIREARIAAGLSQRQLGELIGTTYQQVQKYEQGKNRLNGARIELIISALNRPFSYFYPNATDIRAVSDPAFVAALTTKDGQELMHAFYYVRTPRRRRLVVNVALELKEEEQANG